MHHCSDPLQWRHNDHGGVANHQPHGCLLNRLFRRRSEKTSKLRVTGLCAGNSPGPVNSPHKGQVMQKMVPFDDAIMRGRIQIRVWTHNRPPYLALTVELWDVFCEDFEENWPRYNGTAWYMCFLTIFMTWIWESMTVHRHYIRIINRRYHGPWAVGFTGHSPLCVCVCVCLKAC